MARNQSGERVSTGSSKKKMKRKAKEYRSYADTNYGSIFYHDMYQDISDTFAKCASLLKDRLDAKN